MTAFARSDVMTITIPRDSGGCGEPHARAVTNLAEATRKKNPDEPEYDAVFGVTCPACEPILRTVHGWAARPEDVELTPDEERTKERLEKEGAIATQVMASKLGESLAQMVKGGVEA